MVGVSGWGPGRKGEGSACVGSLLRELWMMMSTDQ